MQKALQGQQAPGEGKLRMARKAGDKQKWIAAVSAGDVQAARKAMAATPGDCMRFMVECSQFRVPDEGLDFVRSGAQAEKDPRRMLDALRKVCAQAVSYVEKERGPYRGHAGALMQKAALALADTAPGNADAVGSEVFCALASANAPELALRWLGLWKSVPGCSGAILPMAAREVKWENCDCLVNSEFVGNKWFAPTPPGILAALGHASAAAEAALLEEPGLRLAPEELAQWESMVSKAWNVRNAQKRLEMLRASWLAASDSVRLESELPKAPAAKERKPGI